MNRSPSGGDKVIKRIAFQEKKKKKKEQIRQILPETKARTFPYFSALKSISFISLQQNYNLILCFL